MSLYVQPDYVTLNIYFFIGGNNALHQAMTNIKCDNPHESVYYCFYYCYYYVRALHMDMCALVSECVYGYVCVTLSMHWLQL